MVGGGVSGNSVSVSGSIWVWDEYSALRSGTDTGDMSKRMGRKMNKRMRAETPRCRGVIVHVSEDERRSLDDRTP